jgi:hypothetical protein
MAPGGSVLNFSFAAALIRVRNRSKDLRRSITVDGIVRPDAASNASSETAQLIRRMPSRISKCMKSPSRVETASDVSLNIDALMPSVARVGTHDDHLAFDWLCLSGVGDAFGFFISRLPYFCLLGILPSLSSLTRSFGLFLRVSSSSAGRSSVRRFRPSLVELDSQLRRAGPSGALMPGDLLVSCRGRPANWHEVHVIRPQT